MNINGYILTNELKNANSGFSKWGFAVKNGKEYFIKELITPVYPVDKSVMPLALFEQRKEYCEEYENRFKEFYGRINKASRGNLIRINEFFRLGSRYYLITEKVEGGSVPISEISSANADKKLLLLKTLAYCFKDLHSVGIVHFDVKPSNVLIKKNEKGNFVAKLIDFDSGFFKNENLEDREIGGDLTYLAPETVLRMCGEDVKLTEKTDIFSLGLLFHEYCYGKLPWFDTKEYEYPYEAVYDNFKLKPDSTNLPSEINDIIASMLDKNPENRPSASQIISLINKLTKQPEKTPAIKQIMVHYGGVYGKTISLTQKSITYKNTVHYDSLPGGVLPSEYPNDYLMARQHPITDLNMHTQIVNNIISSGLWDIVSLRKNDLPNNSIYQAIMCVCEDGKVYSYCTNGVPDSRFEKIVSILSAYCTFPKKFDTVEKKGEAKNENKKDDWFKPAGDL